MSLMRFWEGFFHRFQVNGVMGQRNNFRSHLVFYFLLLCIVHDIQSTLSCNPVEFMSES